MAAKGPRLLCSQSAWPRPLPRPRAEGNRAVSVFAHVDPHLQSQRTGIRPIMDTVCSLACLPAI
eukprot:13734660-Alexandrium_andersonii.AAC.1